MKKNLNIFEVSRIYHKHDKLITRENMGNQLKIWASIRSNFSLQNILFHTTILPNI